MNFIWVTINYFFRMLENLSTELDKTESRLDMVSKKVAQVLQLSDGNLNSIYNINYQFIIMQLMF